MTPELNYLLECVNTHADKFPVPSHIKGLSETVRKQSEGEIDFGQIKAVADRLNKFSTALMTGEVEMVGALADAYETTPLDYNAAINKFLYDLEFMTAINKHLTLVVEGLTVEIGEAADKFCVLGMNHPGGTGQRPGSLVERHLNEDKEFMMGLSKRMQIHYRYAKHFIQTFLRTTP